MDAIVSAALLEICAQGINGISVKDLWQSLQQTVTSSGLPLCDGVKSSIWNGLLKIPGLQSSIKGTNFCSIKSFQEAETLNLKIVAPDHLRDCFVGLYNGDVGISLPQRRMLERLAIARANGVTQSQLSKEFGIKGNNLFYILKSLEYKGLVARQSTTVRTKESATEGENGLKNTSIVNTNLIHLYRYANHLSPQQKLEITKVDTLESQGANADGTTSMLDGFSGEGTKDDVSVKDYIPALKAICDKLDEAEDKVLVVSDIKQALGYRGTQGHRAWRNICNRLKYARLVEEFRAEVDKKVVNCLRLLKKIDPKNLQPKGVASTSDDFDTHQAVKCGKRGQITDQLLELPIDQQIYDMIDAAGSKGIFFTEILKRLGLNNKKNYNRLLTMSSRFGIHLQAETPNRTKQYRVWTSRNFPSGSSNVASDKPEGVLDKDMLSMRSSKDLVLREKSDPIRRQLDSISKDELGTSGQLKSGQTGLLNRCSFAGDVASDRMLICGSSRHDLVPEIVGTHSDEEHDLVSAVTGSIGAAANTTPPASSNSSTHRSYPKYPCLTSTAASTEREQRILQRLQQDKFILRVELYRWLESFEKGKLTKMAPKTLIRTLNKLQQEGLCRCIQVSVPSVTNCGRSRTTEVVLHKSIQSLPPEVISQLVERLRSFDIQIRSEGLTQTKNETLPVLTIKRPPNHGRVDNQSARLEAMRVNGFVFSKMVRARLLHNYLWQYLSNSPDWDDTLFSGRSGYDLKNPHSSCKLLALDVALKAMPLELFLQVVGSTQIYEDLNESCKRNLCLADLPPQEYKSLMDTRGTGRLSWLIDVLRRLKLIRMVTDGNLQDGDKHPHAIVTHAMEIKPYIEEPSSNVSLPFGVSSVDLRPRIRHDFLLSKQDAVDIYWKTLEYCYATADPRAAVHAFPGSSVHEVFLYRSWAAVRVMTADQRAELLKRIVRDESNKKISFADCVKIARDLNLTVEQVLRVSNDKRQSRLTRFEKGLNPSEQNLQPIKSNCLPAPKKRKKSWRERSSKRVKVDDVIGEPCGEINCAVSDTDLQDVEKQDLFKTSSEDHHEVCLLECDEGRQAKNSVPGEEDGEESYDFISQCASSRWKSTRQPKFSWTETSERQLVIQYVRHRAALGAKFHRTNWASLPDLPAPTETCKRRMALFNSNPKVRRAILCLCNLLGERYAKHLAESRQKVLLNQNVEGQIVREFSPDGFNTMETHLKAQQWDDFENPNIKMALDEVLQYNQMSRLEASRRGVLTPEKQWPDTNQDAQASDSNGEPEFTPSITAGEETETYAGKRKRSRCHRLPGKFLKLLNEGISISRRAYDSLAVANAVELLKLVFLSTSTAVEVPNLLADTLRRYSEHDLFAAFNYLRGKKIMVGGNGSQPFVLSQKFLRTLSSSPFPVLTGKRASEFVCFLKEREKDLTEDVVHLNPDLQCGDIFHMTALVSSGELCISPCLPEEGIGEPEEKRGVKCKSYEDELFATLNGEVVSRRAKGFPGINLSVSRATLSGADAVDFFRNEEVKGSSNDNNNSSAVGTSGSLSPLNQLNPSYNFCSIVSVDMVADGSLWKALASFCEHLLSACSDKERLGPLTPELFKSLYSAIRKAGDQGLSIGEISQFICLQGERVVEIVIEVLQVFGLAIKVNAYNCVHVVDASFRSKYFLTTVDGRYQNLKQVSYIKSAKNCGNSCWNQPQKRDSIIETSDNDVHRVTVLNLPEEVSHLSHQVQNHNNEDVNGCVQVRVSMEGVSEGEVYQCMNSSGSHSFLPILPWVNGDGATNQIVYKGLTRRVLGIVMQTPGVLEDDIVRRMSVLNPQSCKKLLELMVIDNHIFVRKMHQTICNSPPTLLGSLFGGGIKKSKSVYREHYFANPMSSTLL